MTLSGVLNTAVDDLAAIVSRFAGNGGGRTVAVAEPGGALGVYKASPKGGVQPVAPGARTAGGGTVELRLPAEAVLTQTLTLPAAGRDFLEPILEHRLERLVPWSPDRALYGYRVTGETSSGEVTVDFAATSRDIADQWIRRAEERGLTPTAIGSAAEPLDAPLTIDLWRGKADPMARRARRLVVLGAAAAAAVVVPLVAVSGYLAYAAENRLEGLEARSAAARRALQDAIGGGKGSREAALTDAKRPDTAMVVLIDRFARALPKDTVLRGLEIEEERIRLTGFSAAAPALIAQLEASGALRGARFAAPVTRTPDGRDSFEIVAARLGAPAAPTDGATAAPDPALP